MTCPVGSGGASLRRAPTERKRGRVKVQTALDKMRRMDPSGVLLVKGKDGQWTRVEDVQFAAVDTIYAPTSMLIEGVRYVREDDAQRKAASGWPPPVVA